MFEWCHSGIEGYCKAAAEMLGDETKKKSAQWLPFCNDIFKTRTDKDITSVWTMSHDRSTSGGRSNRQTVFEKQWLNGRYIKTYIDEAEEAFRRSWDYEGLSTISKESDYAKVLEACGTKEERRQKAILKCEDDAICACIAYMLDTDENGEFVHEPAMPDLVSQGDFPEKFYSSVMRAIERGFVSERYKPSEIQQFMTTLNDQLYSAADSMIDSDNEYAGFRNFARSLIAGLVYGPDNIIALARPWDATHDYREVNYLPATQGEAIRVTQIFDNDLRQIGYSEVYRPSQVVFFGRCPEPDKYKEALSGILAKDGGLSIDLDSKEQIVFPIAYTHVQTSNVHGMLVYENAAWRLYDFASTNGTSVESTETSQTGAKEQVVRTVDGILELMPGDRIRLGAPAEAADVNVYQGASTLLISSYVDELLDNN